MSEISLREKTHGIKHISILNFRAIQLKHVLYVVFLAQRNLSRKRNALFDGPYSNVLKS